MMRLMPVLLAVMLLPSCATADPVSNAPAADLRCEVARQYVARSLARDKGRDVVYGDSPENEITPGFLQWGGDQPSPGLVAAFNEVGRMSAVKACASVRELLDRNHVPYGEQAIARISASEPGYKGVVFYRADIVGISLPVVNADGTEAIFARGDVSGPLSGIGQMFFWKRGSSRDKWLHVSTAKTWTS